MGKKKRNELTPEYLKTVIRSNGRALLKKPNITSIGIGYKIKAGKLTKQLCIQVTVERKMSPEALRLENIPSIDKSITAKDGTVVPIDIVQRSYNTSFEVISDPAARARAEEISPRQIRRKRLNKVMPGVSVSHRNGTAGTLGAVVYDNVTGQPYMLSNWHVLHRTTGQIGDPIVQPGPFDGGNLDENFIGRLTRSHLGLAGDCAIGSIDTRSYNEEILELGLSPQRTGKVNLGDEVIKSGRTTGVTNGIVQRIEVVVNINYGGSVGTQEIGGFEIGPDPSHLPSDGEVSMGGDSGSLWLIHENGKATDIAVGLHFAGETDPDPQAEHALACNIHSVLEKLNVSFVEKEESIIEEEDLINNIFSLVKAQGAQVRDLEARVAKCQCNLGPQKSGAAAPGASSGHETELEGLPVYGNWCGPGHGGGSPIDDLDRACMNHDLCYGHRGYFDCTCDAQLQQNIKQAMATGKVNPWGKVMGSAIAAWFSAQPCISHVVGNQIRGRAVGPATLAHSSGETIKSVARGGKKVWKVI